MRGRAERPVTVVGVAGCHERGAGRSPKQLRARTQDGPAVVAPVHVGVAEVADVGLHDDQLTAHVVRSAPDCVLHGQTVCDALALDVEPVQVHEVRHVLEIALQRVETVDAGGEEGGHAAPGSGYGFGAGASALRGHDGNLPVAVHPAGEDLLERRRLLEESRRDRRFQLQREPQPHGRKEERGQGRRSLGAREVDGCGAGRRHGLQQ